MNTQDLLAQVQQALGGTATRGAAEVALSAVLRAIRTGLVEDGEVKLAGFGSFRMQAVQARRVLLPGSSQALVLPPRNVLRFTPSPANSHNFPGRTQKRLPSSR